MIRYVIAKPYPGGLCYMATSSPFNPVWVPEIHLARVFEYIEIAELIVAFIPGEAIIVEVFVD